MCPGEWEQRDNEAGGSEKKAHNETQVYARMVLLCTRAGSVLACRQRQPATRSGGEERRPTTYIVQTLNNF